MHYLIKYSLYLKTLLRDSVSWSKKHRQKDLSGAESHNLPVKGMYPGHARQPSKARFLRGNLSDGLWVTRVRQPVQ